ESRVLLDISEGKFHQVKKMFLSVGKKVTYLKRLTMGPIELDESIPPGSYRPLDEAELEQLKPYFR
ncbi:MAG: 16S rRNA pseudouridine(516) synthase, partial [Trichococcus flocculiformis]